MNQLLPHYSVVALAVLVGVAVWCILGDVGAHGFSWGKEDTLLGHHHTLSVRGYSFTGRVTTVHCSFSLSCRLFRVEDGYSLHSFFTTHYSSSSFQTKCLLLCSKSQLCSSNFLFKLLPGSPPSSSISKFELVVVSIDWSVRCGLAAPTKESLCLSCRYSEVRAYKLVVNCSTQAATVSCTEVEFGNTLSGSLVTTGNSERPQGGPSPGKFPTLSLIFVVKTQVVLTGVPL